MTLYIYLSIYLLISFSLFTHTHTHTYTLISDYSNLSIYLSFHLSPLAANLFLSLSKRLMTSLSEIS